MVRMPDQPDSLRSVRTTFRILESVATHQPVGLSELARRLGLPKTTVQRSLSTLGEVGWLRTAREGAGRWELSERARTLGDRAGDDGRLREAALPEMGRLNAESQETVHLSVLDGREVRLLERVDTAHVLRIVRPIGTRGVLHASAGGKAILAALPAADLAEYLERDLAPVADRTITDRDALVAELEVIQGRGYAIADQELLPGISSVAACIRSRGARPLGAMSISGPSARITSDLHGRYGELIVAAVDAVTGRLDR